MSAADMRKDYTQRGLSESDLDPDPIAQFARWFEQAVSAGLPEPNAMTLATATRAGRPAARMVLLKSYDPRGFVFYSHYEGRKGGELAENPWAALVFFWPELERQIRIEGRVEQVAAAESDAYFASRPRGSQLGAWASPQSAVLADREGLDRRVREVERRFANQKVVPRPPNWGGYRVVPHTVEFWQGQPSRLHDRLCFTRHNDGTWLLQRLAP
jgi:pyridoxamine 5'-phosphate oxidase